MGGKYSISALIITYNEERCINRAIKSILNIVDEIVVIDTYSTDNTVEIALLSPLVKVFYKEWNNDFSEVRNYGLSKLSNKWCLIIDADEVFSSLLDFKKTIKTLNTNISYCPVIENVNDFNVYNIPRLFYVKDKDRYIGCVHEYLFRSSYNIKNTEIFTLFHDGYEENIYASKFKFERNKFLIEKQLQEEPLSIRWHYYNYKYTTSDNEKRLVFEFFSKIPVPFERESEVYCINIFVLKVLFLIQNNKFCEAYFEINRLIKHYDSSKQLLYLDLLSGFNIMNGHIYGRKLNLNIKYKLLCLDKLCDDKFIYFKPSNADVLKLKYEINEFYSK